MQYQVTDWTRKEKPMCRGFSTYGQAVKFYLKNCHSDARPLIWYKKDDGQWTPSMAENELDQLLAEISFNE